LNVIYRIPKLEAGDPIMLTLTTLSLQSYFQPPTEQEHEVLFQQHYHGPIHQGMVESLLQLIEESAGLRVLPLPFRKRLFLVVIEGLQNAVKYGHKESSQHPVVGFKIEIRKNGEARVCFANYVAEEKIEVFNHHILALKAKSADGLKQLYILRSREKVISRDTKPSAELGLIEITRCASSLRHHFLPAKNAQWFEMEVIVR
jgi:hypothetical protein